MRSGVTQSAGDGHLDAVAATPWAPLALPGAAAHELRRVEARLRSAAAREDCLAALALQLIDAGGKRLRPALVVAAATAVGGPSAVDERVIDAAAAVELIHLASLCHDDVLDAATLRRGRASANARWGNHVAVLGGDVLLSHAYRVASRLGAVELRRLAQTLTDLCAGQVAESAARFDPQRAIEQYDASIRGKTASLLATACWLGGATADGDAASVDALAQFGAETGVAFQIADDVLDLYGHDHALGKAAGSDLRAGVFTLPVLLALGEDRALAGLLVEGIDADGVVEVGRRVRATGADRRAVACALEHLRTGLLRLGEVPLHEEGRRTLTAIAGLVLEPLDRLGLAGRTRHRPERRALQADAA